MGLQLADPEERMAPTSRHGSGRHPGISGSHCGSGSLRGGPCGRTVEAGTRQYVILGAGLDTFAQRNPSLGSHLRVFEIDQPATQAWKRRRLAELGYDIPDWLGFVPVDFESGASWRDQLLATDFDGAEPAIVASTGVAMYLTRDAVAATLGQVAALASGSTVAMSFLLPLEALDASEEPTARGAERGARAEGTPWMSFFTPEEMLELASSAGLVDARHVPGAELAERYFAGRTDGLRPARGEDFLVATTP